MKMLAWISSLVLISSLAVAEEPPPFFEMYPEAFFRGVPADITLHAVDARGRALDDYSGRVRFEGLTQGGKPIAPREMQNGELSLEKVQVGGDSFRIVAGDTSREIRPTRLPGFLTLLPAAVAILLAILTRQVLLSLFSGVWVGALLLTLHPLDAFLRSVDTFVVGSLASSGNASILLFSLTLAGLVGVISATGGVRGIVEVISKFARTARSGQVATWALGLMIFFDDYANSLIVGNTMRPYADKVRISREKLSFIVDATAAPIATIGVISTWTAYQVGLIGDVLPSVDASVLGAEGLPAAYIFFLESIPYSFYSFLMIFLVFLCAVSLRDFGPMRRAEERCRETGAVLREGAQPLVDSSVDHLGDSGDIKPRWFNAAIPILCVVLFTMAGLYTTGVDKVGSDATLREIVGKADSYVALLWAAFGATLIAIVLGRIQGFTLDKLLTSWVGGARSLVLAAMILILAWSIGTVCDHLNTGDYVVSVTEGALSPELIPCLSFLIAGAIAFSTGSSYSTMAILVPILLPLAFRLGADSDLDPDVARGIVLGTLAAILGGAVFGDHCSPISDTTVLSSMASGADHIDHVRTQLPYALLVAAAGLPCYWLVGMGVSPYLCLLLGVALTASAFWWLSRGRPKASGSPD